MKIVERGTVPSAIMLCSFQIVRIIASVSRRTRFKTLEAGLNQDAGLGLRLAPLTRRLCPSQILSTTAVAVLHSLYSGI